MSVAIYPGSFDPPHLGHLDVIVRASHLFGRLVVAVARDSHKQTLFPADERTAMLREATQGLSGVEVAAFTGLTVAFARQVGAQVIVKGLRSVDDLAGEAQQMMMNRHLSGIDTVFLMPSPLYAHVSSTLIREVTRLGGDASAFVPEAVARRLAAAPAAARRRGRRRR